MVVLLEKFSCSFLNGSSQFCYCGSRLAEELLLVVLFVKWCGREEEMKLKQRGQFASR